MSTPPTMVGPWTLLEKLGRGGNATVWSAVRDGQEQPVALKVIGAVKPQREPYRRFVAEIEFLRVLESSDGVLPLIDAHLPESPSRADRPWLAMPIATPITAALAEASLETVVAAAARIAGTLARLKAEHNIGHRDIKPGNLYGTQEDWLIGDFGLIDVPDIEGLTRSDQHLGPAHYTPYEVILDPARADPFPADVYSLGKTLWVLATGYGFPPEGHQPADTRGFSIAANRAHPNAAALDRLVDVATRLHAEERPNIEAVVSDLSAWQELAREPTAVDLGDARLRLRRRLEGQLAAEDLRERQIDMATAAVRRFQELVAPLNDALVDLHPRAELDRSDDPFTRNTMRIHEHSGMPEVVFRWQRCSRVSAGGRHVRFVLRMGRGVDVTADGTLRLHAFVDVGDPETIGAAFYWAVPGPVSAPVGSIAVDRELEMLTAEIGRKLREAVEVFVAHLPST